MIKAILAVDSEFGIGKDNKLPWRHPEDLAYFKSKTLKQLNVMGNNTWKSLPDNMRPLPDRMNAVIASEFDAVLHKGAQFVITPKGLIIDGYADATLFESFAPQVDNDPTEMILSAFYALSTHFGRGGYDTWIIGGASVYELLMPFVDELHMTLVPGAHGCDTHYNPLINEYRSFSLKENIPLMNKHGNYSLTVGIYGANNIQRLDEPVSSAR